MPYRVCKTFEVESGHRLSKHPEKCRFLHGHSRRVEVVLAADALDERDMVCDFKVIKLAVAEHLDGLDHAMAVNSLDPLLPALREMGQRIVVFPEADPTTEVMAKSIYDHLRRQIESGRTFQTDDGVTYRFPAGIRIERVRVWETSGSWAEYQA